MKLASVVADVHSRGVVGRKRFGIAQNAKMFNILSNRLYSQKVMAVIRELSTNASDAHIEAGNLNPFHVHLPNQADPVFRIRDFGTGLSEENMYLVFSEYGESTKTESNKVNGCLGLGSKSPFCYVQSFNVNSYLDGTKFCYICVIDESGFPDLNFLHKEASSEPNGLEISFPVKSVDFEEFCKEAMRVYHYFDNKPIITGGQSAYNFKNHAYSQRDIVISGNGWRVCRFSQDTRGYPTAYNRPKSNIVAVMGNVAYPVEVNSILGENKEVSTNPSILAWNKTFGKDEIDSWRKFVHEVLNRGDLYLEMDFPIGDIDFDPSRENLQYTKDVISTLRYKTQQIYSEIQKSFNDKIKESKYKVEAIKALSDASSLSGGWNTDALWTDSDNKTHKISLGRGIEYKIPANKKLYVFNYMRGSYRSRKEIAEVSEIYFDTIDPRKTYGFNTNPAAFFVCDLKSEQSAKTIISRYCAANKCYAYMLSDPVDCSESDEGFDDLIKDIGGKSNLLKVSAFKGQFVKPRASRSNIGVVSKDDVFLIHGKKIKGSPLSAKYGSSPYLQSIEQKDLDSLPAWKEVVYVPIVRYVATKEFPYIGNIRRLTQNIDTNKLVADIFSQDVFAIKQAAVDKLKSKGVKLIDFNTYVSQKLKQSVTNVSFTHNYFALKDYYKEQFIHTSQKKGYNTLNKPNILLFEIINMFGLSYDSYLSKENCDLIDEILLMIYFGFGYSELTLKDSYSNKIAKIIISKLGLSGNFNSSDLKDQINLIQDYRFVNDSLYIAHTDIRTNLFKLIDKKGTISATVTSKVAAKDMLNKVDKLLDRSPGLAYNLALAYTISRNDNILKITDENNPLAYLTTYDNRAGAFGITNVNDLRNSFSSLIK
jgi:hypothetical protein